MADLVEDYMDDITLGGTRNDVATDVIKIRSEGGHWAYSQTQKKCELIQHSSTSAEPALQDFVIMTPDKASLLGALLTEGPSLDDALYARCGELSRAINRLGLLPTHGALNLLKSYFNAPKIMHTLRCSPCFGNEALEQFDSLLRNVLCTITNLAVSDPQWIQASLPVSAGGLSIR